MFTFRREVESILLIFLGGFLGIFVMTFFNSSFKYKLFPVVLPSIVSAPTPTPTPAPVNSFVKQTTSIDSPDMSKALVLEKEGNERDLRYTLYVLSKEDSYKTFIFTKTVSKDYDITIPENTWSPDGRYIFIKEPHKTFLVYDTKGEILSSNVSTLFELKYPNFILEDVTGWAAPDLLIVNTKKESGDIGPSLWFDVGSESFIQLSTRFN